MKILAHLAACFVLWQTAHAQFYAPPVDFHDVAQRRFPVEAARVLAWIKNREGAHVSEVAYKVTTGRNQELVWDIEWRMSGGGKLRRAVVRYPETALLTGPAWYREVWRQLTGADWKLAGAEAGDPPASFWEGAKGAGITRLEGVGFALQQAAAPGRPAPATCARVAGALVQAALPKLAVTLTLDGSLLDRSAAWLCAAEQISGKPLDAEWSPILALAGREREAKTLWGDGPKFSGDAAPLGLCWDSIIRLPDATKALPQAARQPNRLYAAPVFHAYARVEWEFGKIFNEIAKKLYAGEDFARLQDYGPEINFGNALPNGPTLPLLGLRDWVQFAAKLEPAPSDFAGLPGLAGQVRDFADKKLPESPSAELAALLNARMKEGEGPLIPVAVATGRDLLIFGWELGGTQFGCLQTTYGPIATYGAKAGDVEKNWTGAIAGWTTFVELAKYPAFEPLTDFSQVEHVSWLTVAFKLKNQPPAAWPKGADAFFRRRWLLDPNRALDSLVEHRGEPAQAESLIRRAIRESGPRTVGPLLSRDRLVTPRVLARAPNWPDLPKIVEELRLTVPMNSQVMYREVMRTLEDEPDPFRKAQVMERFHWQYGLGLAPQAVFTHYVQGNAVTSAQRFYDRWHTSMTNRYTFQSTLGAANYALALLEGDEARAKAGPKDIGGTYVSWIEVTEAVLSGDLARARTSLADSLKLATPQMYDYPYLKQMEAFLDLIPALNDRGHADHAKALSAFPKHYYPVLHWVLLTRAKLPEDEAVRFLYDGEQNVEQRLLIAAVKGDKPRFQQLYDELSAENLTLERTRFHADQDPWLYGGQGILNAWLHTRLFAVEAPQEQPDLRPADAEPLLPLLRSIAAEGAPKRR